MMTMMAMMMIMMMDFPALFAYVRGPDEAFGAATGGDIGGKSILPPLLIPPSLSPLSPTHALIIVSSAVLCCGALLAGVPACRTQALTELEHVPFLKIPGAPIEEVEQLVREKLGSNVVDLNDSLFGIMEELCAGNPLMIIELVSHLKV